mmetsp:Transcript_9426/g.28457  ORF Transcript_9426/g.28457 Transcript_9426/m.28457 type:complete len:231 (+) Transcript_9426:1609-2301(+)
MGPAHKVQVEFGQKSLDHISAKRKRDATIIFSPALYLLVGVAPQEIAQEAMFGHIRWPSYSLDLVHRRMIWRKAAVGAKDLFIDDRSDGKTVEHVAKRLPEPHVVPSPALVIEPVDSVDRCTLVIATQNKEVFWVAHFERQEQADGLYALLSSIYVVPHEQVVCRRRKAAILEEPQQIVVLAMDVPAYLDWGLQLQQSVLFHENLSGLHTQLSHLFFPQVNKSSRTLTPD